MGLERTIKLRGDDGPTMKSGPRWWYYTLTLARLGNFEQAQMYFDELSEMMLNAPPRNLLLHQELQAEVAELLGDVSRKDARKDVAQNSSAAE